MLRAMAGRAPQGVHAARHGSSSGFFACPLHMSSCRSAGCAAVHGVCTSQKPCLRPVRLPLTPQRYVRLPLTPQYNVRLPLTPQQYVHLPLAPQQYVCPPLAPQTWPPPQEFMRQHGFSSIEDFRGASLPYFTTHQELVRMQVLWPSLQCLASCHVPHIVAFLVDALSACRACFRAAEKPWPS